MKWNYHLFPFPSSQPSFVPRSPLQLILIFYMFEFTKKSFMLETHTMPFSPPGCDCTCGIGLFSLVYCGVTFVLCGMVLQCWADRLSRVLLQSEFLKSLHCFSFTSLTHADINGHMCTLKVCWCSCLQLGAFFGGGVSSSAAHVCIVCLYLCLWRHAHTLQTAPGKASVTCTLDKRTCSWLL